MSEIHILSLLLCLEYNIYNFILKINRNGSIQSNDNTTDIINGENAGRKKNPLMAPDCY